MEPDAYPQLYDIAERRYSCRSYLPQVPARDTLLAVLDVARLAPSACNRQPWTFVVITDPAILAGVCGCYGRDWLRTAPAVIVAVGHHDLAWHRADGKDHTDVDLAIAVEHICLAATTLGLATCWICNFDAPRLAALMELPQECEPVAIVPIGYPADADVPEKKRKELTDIVRWQHI